MFEGNGWWICVKNFKSMSLKMADIWHKTCQKQTLFTSFRDLTVIFRIFYFLTDFDASKSVLGSFFAFFAKIWPKNMYRSSKSRFFFLFDLFYLVTWHDLDLYYGRKSTVQWYLQMSETQSMPISWLCLCLTSAISLADVTKPEMSNILTLTWPVTSLVTPRSMKFVFPRLFFQGVQMPLEFLESV